MNEQCDISEVQVGDKVVDQDGVLDIVFQVEGRLLRTERNFIYELYSGLMCVGSTRQTIKQKWIKPASADDIARHEKRQLVTALNHTEFSNFSIEKLGRILVEVKR